MNPLIGLALAAMQQKQRQAQNPVAPPTGAGAGMRLPAGEPAGDPMSMNPLIGLALSQIGPQQDQSPPPQAFGTAGYMGQPQQGQGMMGGLAPQGMGGQQDPLAQAAQVGAQKEIEKEIQATQKKLAKSQQDYAEYMQKWQALTMPKPRPAVSSRDLLPAGLAMLVAKLFGANDRDLAQGLGGFMQGRQGWADQQNQSAAQQFGIQRENMGAQMELIKDQGAQIQDAMKALMGRQQDERNYEQRLGEIDRQGEVTGKNQAADDERRLKEIRLKNELNAKNRKPAAAEYRKKALNIKDQTMQTEAVRMIDGWEQSKFDDDPVLMDRFYKLVSSPTFQQLNVEAKTEGQILKNDYQKIFNVMAPDILKGKIKLTEKQIEWLDTKIKNYPEYLRMAAARLGIAQMIAGNTIGNTQFDNSMSAWNASNKPKIDALEAELKSQLTRQATLKKEIGELGDDPDAANEKSQELFRVTNRIKQINLRIGEIADSVMIPPATIGVGGLTVKPNAGSLPAVEGGTFPPGPAKTPAPKRAPAKGQSKAKTSGKPLSKEEIDLAKKIFGGL